MRRGIRFHKILTSGNVVCRHEQIESNAIRFYAFFVVPSCTRDNPAVWKSLFMALSKS